jgi:hypothetical protein
MDPTASEAVGLMVDFIRPVLSAGMDGMVHETEARCSEQLRDMDVPDDPDAAVGAFMQRAYHDIEEDARERGAPMFDIAKVNRRREVQRRSNTSSRTSSCCRWSRPCRAIASAR